MFRIREYDPADLPALYALDQVCFAPEIAYALEEIRYFIEQRNSLTLIAESESGEIVGFSVLERVRSRGKFSAHLITIDVAPGVRQQGIGSALMQAMEERLLLADISCIRLEVAADNDAAQHFYQSFGYQLCGRIEGYYPGNLDALLMEKFLKPKTHKAEL
ncbi:MAG: GNAT family N-acetyltransferase [Acidobacteriaceae bacterium]